MNEQPELPLIDNINWYKFNCDPIAVSLIRSEGNGTVMLKDIDDDPCTEEIIILGGYLERAEEIRKYYKKRLFYGTLDNRFGDNQYRKDLQKCLQREDIFTVHHTEMGMIAKLPEFYAEDRTKEELRKLCDTNTPFDMSIHNKTLEVEYINSTMARYGPSIQYSHWFKTTDDKAVCFMIKHDNPLVDIFQHYANKNKHMKLIGDFFTRAQDNFYFYQARCKVAVYE